jgi:hypothetical protein
MGSGNTLIEFPVGSKLCGSGRSYGEEADRECEDADEEEGEGAQHSAEGVPEATAAPARRRRGLRLRHCC